MEKNHLFYFKNAGAGFKNSYQCIASINFSLGQKKDLPSQVFSASEFKMKKHTL
jgi:hypothetical protein